MQSVGIDYTFAGRPPNAAAKGDEPCGRRRVQGELCAVKCGRLMVTVGVADACQGQLMQVQQRFQGEAMVCADAINV